MALRTIYIKLKDKVIEKIIGAVPTENNYTDAEKQKLAGLSGGTLTPEQITAIAAQIPPVDISNKVDKVTGKGLSTNDYTDEEKNKLAGISGGMTQSQILTRGL